MRLVSLILSSILCLICSVDRGLAGAPQYTQNIKLLLCDVEGLKKFTNFFIQPVICIYEING